MKSKVTVAKYAGLCFGVKRAIDIAEQTCVGKNKIYTLGPLIHNPQEVERLSLKGIKKIKDANKLNNSVLILRTHGVPLGFKDKLRSKNLTLVDATCPFVKRAQDVIKELSKKNVWIVIVGEKSHPEVKALVSYGKGKCIVVEKEGDLKKIKAEGSICVVSQTTQTSGYFNKVVRQIKKINPNVNVYNTICRATVDRQYAAKRIAKQVDIMLVIGGKNSGNTKRLAQICAKFAKTYYIETAAELKKKWLKNSKKIGITAGASTPGWIVSDIKMRIKKLLN
ncbi:4-hydroxy-3-methylbut-2-enyl diphosphate reductase [Elusimicrobiota bacterium]